MRRRRVSKRGQLVSHDDAWSRPKEGIDSAFGQDARRTATISMVESAGWPSVKAMIIEQVTTHFEQGLISDRKKNRQTSKREPCIICMAQPRAET